MNGVGLRCLPSTEEEKTHISQRIPALESLDLGILLYQEDCTDDDTDWGITQFGEILFSSLWPKGQVVIM